MDNELEALAQAIAQRVQRTKPRLVDATVLPVQRPATGSMDPITRESHLRWLRALRRALKYMDVELFFRQALVGKASLDDLTDDEVLELHKTIDRARECYHNGDGITYHEAGLLRAHGG